MITINICDFTLFDTQHYHSTYHLYEDTTMERLSYEDDVLEIHFIEMRKFIRLWRENQLDPFEDILVRWLLLLGMIDARNKRVYDDIYKELEELAMSDEGLLNVFTTWEELSQTPDSIIAYQSRLKAIIDEEAKIDYAEYKGLEKGKIEVILAGAENGLDISILAKITGYSEERVQEILDIG